MVSTCCQVHDGLEGFGTVPPETVTAVDVDHPAIRATGDVTTAGGDSQGGASNAALVGEAVDAAAS